jgi:LPXTG-motif cell wall-anchored protein
MRKLNLFIVLFLLLAAPAFAASISRNLPSRVDPGAQLTVTLSISNIQVGDKVKTFAIEEDVPEGFSISDWSISNIVESNDQVTTQFLGNTYKWQFTPIGSSATITYTTRATSTLGTYNFNATWFDSESGHSSSTIIVRTVTCGDGICEGAETSDNCVQDCPVATTLPATTVTMPSVTTTTTLAPGEVHNPIFIVLVILLVILLILLIVVRKKKKDSMVSI